LPLEVSPWLEGGKQSRVTPFISQLAGNLRGENRRESLYNAMDYVWREFSYDGWLNSAAFSRTSEDIFQSGILGGCSDFALVQATLFRAVGVPSRIVMTANADWMLNFRTNKMSMGEGHSFIEVYLEDRWYLVDPTYRILFSAYDPDDKSYPHGEYFCARGKDFWDMGVKGMADSDRVLKQRAMKYEGNYRIPPYGRNPI